MGKILSIAVPSYNVEQYLNKGLPTYADDRLKETLEVLIVNDGSTDRTAEIAQTYVEQYPEIFRLINKENGGHGSAVNAGIDHATGKYFRVIDGDDWVNTDNLVSLIEQMKTLETDIVIDEKREVHMVTGETEHFQLPDYVEKNKTLQFADICSREDIGSYIMIHTLSVKLEVLKKYKIHLLEHIFYVDYEYIVKATCESRTITFLPIEIYQYLVGNANQSVAAANYVKRYSHHDQVTKEMLRFAASKDYTGSRKAYLERKVNLIVHTQYNIALIFNPDRKEGIKQARELRAYLKTNYPQNAQATDKRYHQAVILHYLGFDDRKLNKLMGRN
ncbi:glycosyltransferase family 2 protein [Hespellia stercorisuis]|uniref:Glycosyltransferase involved in cell wall bisynthesis n=1 Tax=Hespellia stercorisuis DSM 15480 TaxID=1121950 RepID=A0A1M6JXH9_9FIRM|nr:glycosyltransferase family 2 protein [Hespellia stercorisuis]SHJ51384.1 Glycosyltransferase involved in cell wall bisynthesis [Hespellia stercorisuis DSM 15480]